MPGVPWYLLYLRCCENEVGRRYFSRSKVFFPTVLLSKVLMNMGLGIVYSAFSVIISFICWRLVFVLFVSYLWNAACSGWKTSSLFGSVSLCLYISVWLFELLFDPAAQLNCPQMEFCLGKTMPLSAAFWITLEIKIKTQWKHDNFSFHLLLSQYNSSLRVNMFIFYSFSYFISLYCTSLVSSGSLNRNYNSI